MIRHTKLLLVIGLLSALSLPLLSQADNANETLALAKARTISNDVSSKLRTALLEEMGKSGAVGAVQVCTNIAQEIPRQYNQERGQFVRRVSRGYRNTKDQPDKYERAKLRQFDQLNAAHKLAPEYSEIVTEQGQRYLRYLKPLVASAMCIQCHGEKAKVAEPVRNLIAAKYPQDRAFGYHEGDVRGAVSVKILLPKK